MGQGNIEEISTVTEGKNIKFKLSSDEAETKWIALTIESYNALMSALKKVDKGCENGIRWGQECISEDEYIKRIRAGR